MEVVKKSKNVAAVISGSSLMGHLRPQSSWISFSARDCLGMGNFFSWFFTEVLSSLVVFFAISRKNGSQLLWSSLPKILYPGSPFYCRSINERERDRQSRLEAVFGREGRAKRPKRRSKFEKKSKFNPALPKSDFY